MSYGMRGIEREREREDMLLANENSRYTARKLRKL